MGQELYEAYPAYANALEEALAEIDSHLDLSLRDLLFAEPGSEQAKLLDHTTYAQPALFATHLALHRLLGSWGLAPDLLTGHSVGEISAAQISGVLSLSDAAKLICARSTLMGALPSGGAMLAIQASEAQVAEAIEGKEAELSIAALNGPASTVISGKAEAIEAQESLWQEQGAKTKRLAVSHAFHSPLIEPMSEAFAEVAGELSYSEPQIPIVSNLTGEILTAQQATDPAYWVSHLRAPVRFADGVGALAAQGTTALIELGPDPVLTAMAGECLATEERPPALVPTLREGRPEPEAAILALGSAHAAGAKVEWQRFFEGTGAKRVALPTYPFQRKRYWLAAETGGNSDPSASGQVAADHPLLGAIVSVAGEEDGALLTGRLSLATHPWLADHAVGGTVLLPGTAFLELALRAAEQLGAEQVAELTLQAPLVLPESGAVQIQVAVSSPGEDGARELRVFSRPEADRAEELPWALHAEGLLSNEPAGTPEALEAWPPEGAEPLEAEFLYDRMAELGLEYGARLPGAGERLEAGRSALRRGLPGRGPGSRGRALCDPSRPAGLRPARDRPGWHGPGRRGRRAVALLLERGLARRRRGRSAARRALSGRRAQGLALPRRRQRPRPGQGRLVGIAPDLHRAAERGARPTPGAPGDRVARAGVARFEGRLLRSEVALGAGRGR